MSDEIEVAVEEPKKDEIKVEIEDDASKTPEVVDKSLEKTPEEGINELKQRLEAEKRAREEAERRAHEARVNAHKAQAETKDANYNLIVNAIETVKGRGEALKAAYREAMNVGDFEKVAEIQEAIAVNAGQLQELKKGKKAIKEQLQEAEKLPKIEQMPTSTPDLIEQMASRTSPKSAQWLRDNKDNIRDERTIRKMFRAHEDAIDEGLAADSDEYFEFIEGRLGFNRGEENPMSAASAPSQRRSAPPPAAPVSRGNSTRPNVVRLTREQAEMAKMMGMSESDYAKNMLALQKEGKLHR